MTDLGQPVAVDGNGTLSASFRAAFANDLKLCLASSDLTKCRAELECRHGIRPTGGAVGSTCDSCYFSEEGNESFNGEWWPLKEWWW